MRRRIYTLNFALLLGLAAVLTVNAQGPASIPNSAGKSGCPQGTALRVRIAYPNERRVTEPASVQLLMFAGGIFDQMMTDSNGDAMFPGVPPGEYTAHVTGMGIMTTTSETLTLQPCQPSLLFLVYVRPKEERNAQTPGGQISVREFRIPEKARKELEKGADAMEHGNFEEAGKRFSQAAEIYPTYAAAFNNLGVLAIQQKDLSGARRYFERAIAADDRSSSAYWNLGKLDLKEQKFKEAEGPLVKVVALAPNDVEAMTMLANCQLINGENDAAIVTARKVHALPHEKFAVSHVIAARALEASSQPAEAIKEYELFLQESPDNPLAPDARNSIERLQADQVVRKR